MDRIFFLIKVAKKLFFAQFDEKLLKTVNKKLEGVIFEIPHFAIATFGMTAGGHVGKCGGGKPIASFLTANIHPEMSFVNGGK